MEHKGETVAKILTLGMLKPDAIESGKAGLIIAHLQKEGFVLRAGRLTRLTQAQAAAFYEVHKERPFYKDLCAFMTSGPVFPMALEREDDLTPGLCGYWVARHSGDCGTWYYGIGQGWVSGGDMVNRVANSQHANYVGHSGCSTNTPSCPGVSYAWTSY